MSSVNYLLLCVILLFVQVHGHSWLHCADYTEENGQFWSADKCRAYPRDFATKYQYLGNVFGGDVGMDYKPTDNSPACQSALSANSYNGAYQRATYSVGQRVCLAWAPKNHVAAACNNPNIGDSGTKIYRSGPNPTSELTLAQYRNNLVHDFGRNTKSGEGAGFQNCPDFCKNPDKGLCTGCFNIPDMPQGKYSFMWLWGFNSPTDLYSTCFDVEIVANSGKSIASTLPHYGPDEFASLPSSATATNGNGNNNGNTNANTGNNNNNGNTNTNTGTNNNGNTNTNTGNNNGNTNTNTNTGNNNGNTNTGNNNGNTGNNNGNTGNNNGNTGNNNGNTNTNTNGNSGAFPTVPPAVCLPIERSCVPGTERCICRQGQCNNRLTCASDMCVDRSTVIDKIENSSFSLLPSSITSVLSLLLLAWWAKL